MKYEYEFEDRFRARMRRECNFAIVGAVIAGVSYVGSLIAGAGAAVAAAGTAAAGTVATGLAAVGVGEATAAALGTAFVGAGTGAALGAGEAAITGGDPGMGALGGAISGGVLAGAGGPLGSALGSSTAGNVLAGSAGGALAAGATGSDVGMGALTGAGSGLIQSAVAGDLTGGGTAPPNAAGPVAPVGGYTGAAPIESVTSSALAPISGVTPTLAGIPNRAPTAGDKTGTESVTVHAPTAAGGSALTPTGAGALTAKAPGSNLDSKFSSIYGAPGPGVTGTAGTANVGNTSNTGTENVTVTAEGLAQPKVGSITPTAAGLTSGTGVAGQGQDTTTGEDKDKDKTFLEKLQGKTEDMLSNPVTLLAGGALFADATGMFHGGNASGELAGGAGAQAGALTGTAKDTAVEAERLRALGNTDILKGQDLQDYLRTGTLPPGYEARINAARESAKAGTRQMYSNMGMGQGNTSLYQDLANIDMTAAGASADIATKLFDSGTALQGTGNSLISSALSYTNAGTDIYTDLLKTNIASDNNLSAGVNNFVTALANMGRSATTATA